MSLKSSTTKKKKKEIPFIAKRLMKELVRIEKSNLEGIRVFPSKTDTFFWLAMIDGPPETPYEDGHFQISIRFSDEYPIRPPSVQFLDIPFHPNINNA